MIILSIETSCDETAVSIVRAEGALEDPRFVVLGNSLFSQVEIHKEYGGVFPTLAKREHARNLVPLLEKTLVESGLASQNITAKELPEKEIREMLKREEGLADKLIDLCQKYEKPAIDVISVTSGPGLEPALWVGISFAEALGKIWGMPVIGINHMEGHIASVLFKTDEIKNQESKTKDKIQFPAVALLISGGHTEIVEIENWGQYKILGQTRDDAVGEAFDKVARMLDLPYPGGPQISKLAQIAREKNTERKANLPRPMIHSDNLDFSFSGLKTAVLYYIKKIGKLSEEDKEDIAREFEDAVVDILLNKIKKALDETGAETVIVAGGVIANKKIRDTFTALEKDYGKISVKIPATNMATDNSLMIACATYLNVILHPQILTNSPKITANGNLKLE